MVDPKPLYALRRAGAVCSVLALLLSAPSASSPAGSEAERRLRQALEAVNDETLWLSRRHQACGALRASQVAYYGGDLVAAAVGLASIMAREDVDIALRWKAARTLRSYTEDAPEDRWLLIQSILPDVIRSIETGDGDFVLFEQACLIFSDVGSLARPAVETLLVTLADPNDEVRVLSARALGRIGDARARPALEARAREDCFEPVMEAARLALSELESGQ